MSFNKSGCCKSVRKVGAESRDLFYVLAQNLYMLHVLPAQDKLVFQQVTPITPMYVSQYSHNLQNVDLL